MKKDGIDVAIAAFLGARLSGESVEQARKNAEAMLDFFGVPRLAQAIEAQRAATVKQGAVADESAVANGDAPKETP